MNSHSNLNINLCTIKQQLHSAEDSDYNGDSLADEVSQLSMDEFSFDTVYTAYRAEAHKMKQRAAKTKIEKIHGNTKLGLPYILDFWHDCCSHARISVQVQLLSGTEAYKKVFVRISTDDNELILTLPISPYMSRSFNTFLLEDNKDNGQRRTT